MSVRRDGVPGEFSESVKGARQYGARLKAYIAMPAACGMAWIRRIKTLLGAVFGLKISEGAIARTAAERGERLSGPARAIRAAVLGRRRYLLTKRG
ncbi:MAG: hypothetical protein LBG27_10300 [Spirochaetaceae bacterium]|jgi:hypothetical protein|nr:hypothetical protein [Spirochaetaceae bacterium]